MDGSGADSSGIGSGIGPDFRADGPGTDSTAADGVDESGIGPGSGVGMSSFFDSSVCISISHTRSEFCSNNETRIALEELNYKCTQRKK